MTKYLIHIAAVFALLGAAGPIFAQGDAGDVLYVIAHPDVELGTVDRAELTAIFTTRKQFDNRGTRLIPMNLPPEDPRRTNFDRNVLGLDSAQSARFWIDARIRGEGAPPRQIGTADLAVRVITRLPGSVAYVPSVPPGAGVRILAEVRNGRVVPRSP
jgi:hypothetical protein